MSVQLALALPSVAASNTVVINARCSLRVEEDQRVIVVAGLPVHHYCAGDAVAKAYAIDPAGWPPYASLPLTYHPVPDIA